MMKNTMRIYKKGNDKPIVKMETAFERASDIWRHLTLIRAELIMAGEPEEKVNAFAVPHVFEGRRFMSTYHKTNGATKHKSPNECILFGSDEDAVDWGGQEYGIDIYPSGLVLSTGKKGYNIFGAGSDAYFYKITKTSIKSSSAWQARKFTAAGMLKYLEDHKDTFEFCVTQHGWHLGAEFTCPYAEEDYHETLSAMSARKRKTEEEKMARLIAMISKINYKDEPDIPSETLLPDSPLEEAIYRMTDLQLMPEIVTDFKKSGKVFMSEFGGVLYDPDEECKKAIENTKEYGLPYHVVKTQMEFGPVYAVLYVSDEKDAWPEERYDKRYGEILSSVWMPQYQSSEGGMIGVSPANGGLMRTA